MVDRIRKDLEVMQIKYPAGYICTEWRPPFPPDLFRSVLRYSGRQREEQIIIVTGNEENENIFAHLDIFGFTPRPINAPLILFIQPGRCEIVRLIYSDQTER